MSLGMLGKYERLSVLGRGVSGIVYLAKDTLLNRQVALKEVDVQAGDLRRFLEEARVMDRLRHPNIVRVNGIDRIEDKVVIDMEYVRGKNLQETLRAEGPLSIPRTLDIGIQVLDALDYAHSMQTVHRDIKPANILLGRDGAKLADFGLAEILATNAYACGAGTYAYMAPEDFEEENHSDSQSDIWAVSVTLFEMITGSRPFDVYNPKSPFAWKRALETQEPKALCVILPEAPPRLGAIIGKGLARSKDLRYLTAGEFRSDLAGVRDSLPETARSVVTGVQAQFGAVYGLTLQPAGMPAQEIFSENVWARDRVRRSEPTRDGPSIRPTAVGDGGTDTITSLPTQIQVAEPREQKRRMSFLGLRAREARLAVWPISIDFGSVRSGESRQAKLTARISNLVGESAGKAFSASDWLSVEPTEFDSARQKISVFAHTDRAPKLGVVEDCVHVETRAGTVVVPVHVNILKPRPTFRQVAHWFIPLFGVALAPAVITGMVGNAQTVLFAPAAVSSLAMGLMLLMIAVAADAGIRERVACGIMMTCMCFVLGVSVAASQRSGYNGALTRGVNIAATTGIELGLIVTVQFLTAKRWRFWGVVLVLLGILLGGVCYHVAVS
jgi:serine/threonine-protein kinase